jgi:hypothetical protein
MAVTLVSRSSTRALIDTFITLASSVIRNCVRASSARTTRPPPAGDVEVAVMPHPPTRTVRREQRLRGGLERVQRHPTGRLDPR